MQETPRWVWAETEGELTVQPIKVEGQRVTHIGSPIDYPLDAWKPLGAVTVTLNQPTERGFAYAILANPSHHTLPEVVYLRNAMVQQAGSTHRTPLNEWTILGRVQPLKEPGPLKEP